MEKLRHHLISKPVSNDSPSAVRRLTHIFLHLSTLVVACSVASSAMAWGFGQMAVQSSLGQPFRAQITLVGADSVNAESGCFKASLNTLDGTLLAPVRTRVTNNGTTTTVSLVAPSANEPAIMLQVAYQCAPQMRREYPILLDPPLSTTATAPIAAPRQTVIPFPATEDAAVASPSVVADGETVAQPKRKRRQAAPAVAVDENAQQLAPSPPLPKAATAKKPSDKPVKNVLRLGGGDDLGNLMPNGEMRLALSYSLGSLPAADAPPTATADSTPAAITDPEFAALQSKIRQLEARTNDLRKLNAAQQSALDAAQQKESSSSSWLYLYYVLLLGVIAAIVWLVWRMRQMRAELDHSSWQEIVPQYEHRDDEEDRLFDDAGDFDQAKSVNMPVGSAAATATAAASMSNGGNSRNSTQVAGGNGRQDEPQENDYQFFTKMQSELANAEEILDEIQQAEFWMYMNQPLRAIEILENQGHEVRPNSPLPWLYLFDLYRMVGHREKYQVLAARFKSVFNCKAAPWEEDQVEPSRSLEDFPVMEKIIELWPTDKLVAFLEDLLIDNRDGQRQGFDLAAYRDLLFLTNIAYKIQPSKDASNMLMDFHV